MAFNKSLKLLNYCKENNTKLQLFTELTHDFLVGDYVYIIGGYYDNTKSLLNGTDMFSSFKKGYKILSVNTSNNSFIIDYTADVLTLVYPYGTPLNKFGNPQDNINLAYNNYSTNNLYKSIYVSKFAFSSGTIENIEIRNGVFGRDNLQVTMNRINGANNKINISHIVAKNVKATSSIIKSKTDISGDIIQKMRISENLSSGVPTNPFSISTENTTINNSGYGFNVFEKFINVPTVQTIIENGMFDNIGNITLSNIKMTGGKIGSSEIVYGINLGSSQLSNVDIFNFNSTNSLDISNSRISTFIPVPVISAEYLTVAGDGLNGLRLNVDYRYLANKILTMSGSYILFGIKNANNFDILNSIEDVDLNSATYTFGDLDSAYIEFKLPGFSDLEWTQFITDNPIFSLNFDNFKIHKKESTYWKNVTDISNSTISSYMVKDAQSALDYIYIKSSEIIYGHYENIFYNFSTQFNGSYVSPIYLKNTVQIFTSYAEEMDSIRNHYGCYVDINTSIKGSFSGSKIVNGWVYRSEISETDVLNDNQGTFITNSVLYDGARIDKEVFWNKINVNFMAPTDIIVNNDIIEVSYLGGRKTKWINATTNMLSDNINKIESKGSNDYYNAQHNIEGGSLDFETRLSFEVPNLTKINAHDVIDEVGFDIQLAMVEDYESKYNGGNNSWEKATISDIRVLYGSNPAEISDSGMVSNLLSKYSYVPGSGTTFPGVPYNTVSLNKNIVTGVPDDVVYEKDFDNFFATDNRPIRMNVSANVIDTTPGNFPDYTINEPDIDNTIYLDLNTNIGPDVLNIHNGDGMITPLNVPSGISKLILRNDHTFLDNGSILATNVKNTFIEVERVLLLRRDASNDDVLDFTIKNCNFNPTGINNLNTIAYSSYPTSSLIKDTANNFVTIEINNTTHEYLEVHVEYWITWFYNIVIPSTTGNAYDTDVIVSGHRTKHVMKNKFVYSGETYNIITVGGDNIVTVGGDNINYNI